MAVQSDLWGARPPSNEAGHRTFYPPRAPYIHGSTTSQEAAREIEPHLNRLQFDVYEYLRYYGPVGATDEEIQHDLRISPSTERPRRVELVRLGLVKDSGRKRKTRSGRNATVWIAVGPIPQPHRPRTSAAGGGGWPSGSI